MLIKKKRKKTFWPWLLLTLDLMLWTAQSACPNEFLDTGQGSLPPVEWNGEVVSSDGPLYYCPAMAKCKFKCMADSDLTPSFAINGRCYPVTELSKAFGGARVERQHPYYTFEHNCTSGMRFRCVNSQSRYSPSYTSVEQCEVTPSLLPGVSTMPPDGTPSNTTNPSSTEEIDNGFGALHGSVLALGVAIAITVMVGAATIIILIYWIRSRNRTFSSDAHVMADHPRLATMTEDDSRDVTVVIDDTSTVATATESNTATVECTSGAFSFGVDASEVLIIDDTSSSVTEVADSSSGDARDDPDGGEEDDLPFPVQSAGHTSPTAFVDGFV